MVYLFYWFHYNLSIKFYERLCVVREKIFEIIYLDAQSANIKLGKSYSPTHTTSQISLRQLVQKI